MKIYDEVISVKEDPSCSNTVTVYCNRHLGCETVKSKVKTEAGVLSE